MTGTHEGINLISNLGKIINFGILFLLLYLLARSPLAKFIKNKRDSINEEIESSFRKRDEVEIRLREIRKRLENIESEINQIISKGEIDATSEREEILDEARREAEKIILEAKELIEEEKRKAIDQLRKYSAELLMGKVIERIKESFGEGEHRKIIRKAMDEVRKAL